MGNFSKPIPRLWFDSSSQERPASYGQCDCDCACSTSAVTSEEALSGFFAQRLNAGEIQDIAFNPDTFLNRVGLHWAVLNAQGAKMVVLDRQVHRLFSYLPSTQAALRTRLSEWPTGVFEGVISSLLATNVLSSPQIEHVDRIQGKSDTLVALLHLTNRCNLSCAYCYVNRADRQMDTSTAQRAVDAVFRSALVHGYARVKLKYAGGEPTLHFEALKAAQQRAEALSARTGIDLDAVLLTNGVRISDDQIDTLLAHDIRITVSLDGLGEYQDVQRPLADRSGSSFELVTRTLDRLFAHGISPHISVTITKQSLDGLPALVEYLLSRDLRFSFNFYRETDFSPEEDTLAFTPDEMIEGLKSAFQVIENRLPEYSLLPNLADRVNLQAPHLRTCGVGRNYMTIDPGGNISKCQMDIAHPVTTIDADDPLAFVRADTEGIQSLTVDQKECRKCVWRYRCTGGCPRLTYQRIGRYDARSPLCEVYRAILPQVVRLEAMRLVRYEEPWGFDLAAR